MERRREPRLPAARKVGLILLDPSGQSPDQHLDAELTEISGKGARLRTKHPLKVGSAVRIDVDDSVLLGEVCHCSRAEHGYLCGIDVDQILSHVQDLTRLMQALLGEPAEHPASGKLVALRIRH